MTRSGPAPTPAPTPPRLRPYDPRMACLVGLLALVAPRFAIVLVVLFSDAIGTAFGTFLWPLLGFFFLPLTVLAYTWAWHHGAGSIDGIGLVLVVIAVLIDLGIIGGHATRARRDAGTA